MPKPTRPARKPLPPPPLARSPKRRRFDSRADAVTTTIALPRPLHERARLAAFRANMSFTMLLATALASWLDQHETAASRGGHS
jgi:hypothetical protein